ncbi:MAG: hypothetical protein JJE19_04205 [Methanosarcinales archaeon]|nr:hypothetical protein [Methanosarcinales archaeon]
MTKERAAYYCTRRVAPDTENGSKDKEAPTVYDELFGSSGLISQPF